MAYATANPPRLISQGVGAAAGSLWHYIDGDPLATVLDADYISDGDALGMAANDTLIFTDSTLGEVHLLRVSAVTASGAATLSGAGGGGAEVLSAARTVLASESGMTFFLALAGGFTVTLPAPALGLELEFIVSVAPTTAYIIATDSGDDVIVAGIAELEVDTSNDGPYDDNADAFNFVASVAVVGDRVKFISDGTKWYGIGQTNADGGVTMSTT